MFYTEHKKETEIARKLNIVNSYVTKIIKKDARYIAEKEKRKLENKEKNKILKREYIKKKREREKEEYQAMLIQIDDDNKSMSKKKRISDKEFAIWNRKAYEYDKNSSDLILKKDINAGYAVAKRVSDIIDPSFIKVKYR